MTENQTLATRLLWAMERLMLENAALKAIIQAYDPQIPWAAHLSQMQANPDVNAAIRQQFAELRVQVEAESSLAEGIHRLLSIFPSNKLEN
jgi:hypothetical protein